jgi:hypothetical protein
MKLQHLATVVLLSLTTVAFQHQTQAQSTASQIADSPAQGNFGLYLNPIAIRASNSVKDTGPYAFLGENSTSQVFYGYNFGAFYDFFHSGSLATGFEMRFSDLHANNAMMRNFLVGIRVSGQPTHRPLKPYLQLSVGEGTTKAPKSTVHVSKLDYAVFGGLDYTLARHVDLRAIEIGYGSLTTVSTATVGAGGSFAIPASTMLHFSSGLVFRF